MRLPITPFSAVTTCEQVYYAQFVGDTSERELSCVDAAQHHPIVGFSRVPLVPLDYADDVPDLFDELLTCTRCEDRYTTNASGICEACRKQEMIDETERPWYADEDDEPEPDDLAICPVCHGTGRDWDLPCFECNGLGRLW